MSGKSTLVADQAQIRLVADIPRAHAAGRPDKAAMVFGDHEVTYADLDRRASLVANGLIAEGVALQSRIAILDKNSDTFFEILFGATKANAVLVAVNWRLAAPEIAYVINDAMADLLFVGADYFGVIDAVRGGLKTVKKIIALGGAHSEWECYEGWRDRQSANDPQVPTGGSDVALQLYTSGTTGYPKGAQLTNDNLLALMPSVLLEWGWLEEDDVNLVALPLFHIGGSGYALVGFYTGATNVIARETSPVEIIRLIQEHRVTKSFLVPALLIFMLQTPGVQDADFSSLKTIIYGASPAPLALLRAAILTFECEFAQVYGLTETTGAITYLRPEEHDPEGGERMLSCGRPHSFVDIRIVNGEGQELSAGEIGEIVCRSRQNMRGYWNLPEATAGTIRGEWLHTGDAGYLDAEGYLYIHDRIKDMIISGGENIYPAEVESVLFGHPAVADVAVIGVPDDRWGESVKAIVVKKAGAEVTEDEIIGYSRERIAHYKAPKSVDFAGSLPRNPSGKILKRQLRAPYWEGRRRQVN